MLTVYCYPKCSTCQKALQWLDANHVQYQLLNIKEQNPNQSVLRAAWQMSGLPLKRFFNTSGMLYRQRNLTALLPAMTEEDQLALLASDGMLVRRPLVIGEGFVLVGFREKEWAMHLMNN